MDKTKSWTAFIVITIIFIGCILGVNLWVSQQIHEVEQGYTAIPGNTDMLKQQHSETQKKRYSNVKIDPQNDPLAPRVKKQSSPAKKAGSPQTPSQPVYEKSAKTPILVQ